MNTLLHFKNFYEEIRSSNSRKYKQEVLQKYKYDEVIKKYLKIAFDPYTVYGISTKKLYKEVKVGDTWCAPTVFDLFDYLEVHNTGRDQDVAVCQLAMDWLAGDDQEAARLLEFLICKELVIGCDAKTINSVMPDLIPTFNVQLAQKYFEKPEKLEGKTFAITTKIDGGRIIAIKENGQVSFFTRAGQKYEGLVDLEREMQLYMDDNTVLDGEITLLDPKGLSSKEQYKETMKITRKDGEKHGIKMIVFDYMSAAEFKTQQSAFTYRQRRMMIENFWPSEELKFFEVLPILYWGSDTSVIPTLLDKAIANGEEGIMINDCEAFYEFGRTWSLMKVKKMNTLDLEIIGFEEGSGRLAGTLGAILVRYKNNNVVKVGSGFSDGLRDLIWENQDDYLGAICEIQYFEETTNADGGISLRFPIFKDFRSDKLEADF
jgi:DNA ligase-1